MTRQMIIGMHLGNGYGALAGAWRMPGVDPTSYTSFDAKVQQAQAAALGHLLSQNQLLSRRPKLRTFATQGLLRACI